MKKFKSIYSYFFPKVDEIDQISSQLLKGLLFDKSTEESILIFNSLKAKFENELQKREFESNSQIMLINRYFKKRLPVNHIDVKDPIFERPLKETIN